MFTYDGKTKGEVMELERGTGNRLKPRLNDQTFPYNIVFVTHVTHDMEWLNEQTMFDQTLNIYQSEPTKRFVRITAEIMAQRHIDSVSDWLLFPLGLALFAEVGTVFTRISAAALIKFFAPQVRRLFEGGAYFNCKERLLIVSISLLLRQKWR